MLKYLKSLLNSDTRNVELNKVYKLNRSNPFDETYVLVTETRAADDGTRWVRYCFCNSDGTPIGNSSLTRWTLKEKDFLFIYS